MADISTLAVAVIGAAGGGAVTGVAAMLRGRLAVRSAARLIHAELTENTAPVRYFCNVGVWPATNVRHTAWDRYAVTLSRMRSAESFHRIQKGYSALEGLAYVAEQHGSQDAMPEEVANRVIDASIGEVRIALEKAGTLAGIAGEDLRSEVDAMVRQAGGSNGDSTTVDGGATPPWILDEIVNAGSGTEIVSAQGTLLEVEQRVTRAGVGAPRRLHRTIFDAQRTENAEPTLVARAEGDPPSEDVAVDEAYDALGACYDFFFEVFERDSIDGQGLPLEAVVHYGENLCNAFWDGRRMAIGDGDQQLFNRFTIALDILAHEFAFGVIQSEARLVYANQAGALIHSVGNVFGVLVKQYKLGQTADEADWLMGAGLLGPKVKGEALQSLAAPGTAYDDPVLGKDPQPAHMDGYVKTEADNGGIHINAGIPNHAFFTIATSLGGYAWDRAGHIWYEALRDPALKPQSRFRTFAGATRRTAARLYGDGSTEESAVEAGWAKVGIKL